jgi:3-hydroxybutyrate dehydrogenase
VTSNGGDVRARLERPVGRADPGPVLAGRTALITGSTQGLGLAAAERFAQSGCNLVLNGFADPARIAGIQRDIEARHGVRTLYNAANLRHPSEIEHLIASAADEFGSIDILVNNAVVRHAAPIEQFSPAQWDEAMAVNLSAAFHTIRLALPMMRERHWGRIINLSSIYGLRGAANRVGYVTTKTALVGLTRAIAIETAGQPITCNAICPGTTRTPVHESAIEDAMATRGVPWEAAERTLLAGKQPTGRLIGAEQVAGLMVFLCGPDSGDITGAVLPIDGGWSSS